MRIQLSSAAHKQAPEYTLMYTYDIRRLPRSLHLMNGLWIILEKRDAAISTGQVEMKRVGYEK
jgi:hypothetical protein